jgi:DNA-binding IclR family transcriptional regulator
MAEVPFRETRLIVARLLHDVLRLGHGAFAELPFMQAVEVTVIITAIFSAENDGKPFNVLGLSKHLGMPRATVFRRLSFLDRKGIVHRDDQGLRINPQIFATPSRDENIRHLRQIIIDAGTALSKMET